MKIQPLHDRVLVKRVTEGESKEGSLYIPDSAKEKPQIGEIVAIGAGKRTHAGERMALDVKVGDRVLFGKYSGSEVTVEESGEYVILQEDEVLGVLTGDVGIDTD